MRAIATAVTYLFLVLAFAATARAEESKIRVGPTDAYLTVPPGIERPPVALLIAGSGSIDHDGNGPKVKPATLKKLAEQLAARGIATLRYDKRGAGGWKTEFGDPKDFRFKDYVDDAARQELISRSAKLAYPIRDGIPIMLPEEARKIE